jgi:hypothetical protein
VFVAATVDGSSLPTLSYNLRGKSITDPMGPIPTDPLEPEEPTGTKGFPVVGDPALPDPTQPMDPITDPFTPYPFELG